MRGVGFGFRSHPLRPRGLGAGPRVSQPIEDRPGPRGCRCRLGGHSDVSSLPYARWPYAPAGGVADVAVRPASAGVNGPIPPSCACAAPGARAGRRGQAAGRRMGETPGPRPSVTDGESGRPDPSPPLTRRHSGREAQTATGRGRPGRETRHATRDPRPGVARVEGSGNEVRRTRVSAATVGRESSKEASHLPPVLNVRSFPSLLFSMSSHCAD